MAYVEPIKGEVSKTDALTPCPTGYRSEQLRCITAWDQAPKTQAKRGACPNGTLAEFTAWCTAVVTDLSNHSLDMMEGYKFKDFNRVYLAYQLAGKTPLAKPEDGAVLAKAKLDRSAAGQPWQPVHQREQAASPQTGQENPGEKPLTAKEQDRLLVDRFKQAPASDNTSGSSPQPSPQEAVGKALKGLFGR